MVSLRAGLKHLERFRPQVTSAPAAKHIFAGGPIYIRGFRLIRLYYKQESINKFYYYKNFSDYNKREILAQTAKK